MPYFMFLFSAGFCAWDVSKGMYGWAVLFAFMTLFWLIAVIKEY